jgi:tRNA G18 (ribose-2'-O)-methylase SpoU
VYVKIIKIMKQLRKKDVQKHFKDLPNRIHEIILTLENIQYATNVANIFRSSEAAGVSKLYLAGATKTPPFGKDLRKVSRATEDRLSYEYTPNIVDHLRKLKEEGYTIIAIEVTDNNILLDDLKDFLSDKTKVCFVAGSEDSGVSQKVLDLCDCSVTIPMYGKNASLNVNVSVGIVLFSF